MKNLFGLLAFLFISTGTLKAQQMFILEVQDGIYTITEKAISQYSMGQYHFVGKISMTEEEVNKFIAGVEKLKEPSGPFGGSPNIDIDYIPVEKYYYAQCEGNEDYQPEPRTAVLTISVYGYGVVLKDVGCSPVEVWRLGPTANADKIVKLLKGEYESNSVKLTD